ncbi:MAG: MgtC/SapB family protein [Planctomycetes bacterium]|nr:MgtC/SapB family protein [Planctomycetota bacterium]MBI3845593.1 MgtC/SapB family protein [Planctomycetota bacterium]
MNEFLASPTVHVFLQVVVAALLGLFVGLERERSKEYRADESAAVTEERRFAGIRTFSIVSVTGYAAALLSAEIQASVFVVGLAIVGGLAAISHFVAGERHPGTTTEVAFVLTYLLGGLVHAEQLLLASVLALLLTAMLASKPALHHFAHSVTRDDIQSALKFGAITLVILPLLPDRTFDPLQAVNPRNVWLMVVLVSGIGFAGYILVKLFGSRAGTGLIGILGGLVSSTATTLTFSQRSRDTQGMARGFAMAILLSCTVMYPRVVALAAVTNRSFGAALALPLGVIMVLVLIVTGVAYVRTQRNGADSGAQPTFRNPFELMPAIRFALVFAVILVVVKLAQRNLGTSGLYVVSFASGLVEMDAVTLSIARLDAQGGVDRSTAVAAVVLACLANCLVKAAIVWLMGVTSLRRAAGVPLVVFAIVTGLIFAALIGGVVF